MIFTGAGVSTNSGIPDYRGPTGIWKTKQPVYYQEFMTSEAARLEYWEFKCEDWEAYRDAQPCRNHYAVVDLEKAGKICAVITQNIDGLHLRAGTSPEKLVEIHGTNSAVECQRCLKRTAPDSHFEYFKKTEKPPVCECGGFLKPATISFGQQLRTEDMARAASAVESADMVISLGSTLSVYPAASLPFAAAERGVPYIIINRGVTEHDGSPLVTLRIEGDVDEIFTPAVEAALS